jgi:hypothetical protein
MMVSKAIEPQIRDVMDVCQKKEEKKVGAGNYSCVDAVACLRLYQG